MKNRKDTDSSKKSKVMKEAKEWIISLTFAAVLATAVRAYALTRVDVDGVSMASTLKNKDVMFQEKISLYLHEFKRGSIITFDSKDKKQRAYIKRVIGLAGDQIEIKNGKVYLNGKELNEGYLSEGTTTEGGDFLRENVKYTVPGNHIFVMGDNREVSYDSRYFGPINVSDIEGHVFLRAYPFSELKLFK